jgi:phosphoribosylanthranilate isomerase
MTIKVCGITRLADALAAARLGVHAVGFVLWPGSPRAVTAARVQPIIEALPPFVTPVGVFVDPDPDALRAAQAAGVRVAQVVGALPETPPGMTVLPVAHLAADGGLTPARPGTTAVLIDAHDPRRRGGTGRVIDWPAVARIAATRPVILAGGLTADNVGEAIRLATPAGVDVSSGVESAPGVKDHAKLAAFVAAVRRTA